jgi:hypothetical protein
MARACPVSRRQACVVCRTWIACRRVSRARAMAVATAPFRSVRVSAAGRALVASPPTAPAFPTATASKAFAIIPPDRLSACALPALWAPIVGTPARTAHSSHHTVTAWYVAVIPAGQAPAARPSVPITGILSTPMAPAIAPLSWATTAGLFFSGPFYKKFLRALFGFIISCSFK